MGSPDKQTYADSCMYCCIHMSGPKQVPPERVLVSNGGAAKSQKEYCTFLAIQASTAESGVRLDSARGAKCAQSRSPF